MSDFKELIQQALALGAGFNAAKAAALKINLDLTPEAQERAATAAMERVSQQFGQKFDALGRRLDLERDAASEAAARARPTLDLTDTAALVRTEQAWSHNVRPLLERGESLSDALERADLDSVLGAERFAAGWLAQHATPDNDQDLRAVTRQAVSRALAGLQGDPEKGRAILAGDSATEDHSNALAVLSHARAGRTLEATMLAHYAGENSAD